MPIAGCGNKLPQHRRKKQDDDGGRERYEQKHARMLARVTSTSEAIGDPRHFARATSMAINVEKATLSYNDFVAQYLRPLKPCIINGLAGDWPATREWTQLEGDHKVPRLSALKELFGKSSACITLCNRRNANGDAVQIDIPVSEFIDVLESKSSSDEFSTADLPYLKDFHFMRAGDSVKQFYTVPRFFEGTLFIPSSQL
jgi:hypothetical protein